MAGHAGAPVRVRCQSPAHAGSCSARIAVFAILCAFVSIPAFAQEVFTYTNTSNGERDLALGYPVPIPVDSQIPIEGFRSYASLHARHQALAVEHEFINAHIVGRTIKGRDIWAYTVSDYPDSQTVGGFAEPAFFINGTIHAREWVSPEVVTGILERFAEQGNDGGLYQYLVENANLVIIPVLNVDGFLQTQRYPAKVILETDPDDPTNAPRDGRMRRKNMRGADDDLFTFNDHLNGVDLNRNNPPYSPSNRASANPDSLIFHGKGVHNQPETRALAAAVPLAPGDELRLYTDFHSFAASFFDRLTGNQRRNAIHGRLIAQARDSLSAQGSPYSRAPDGGVPGIGSTDEYFAHTFQIPAWTLELEPRGPEGGTQYGGKGVTHDGFILPDSEIARVREEIANTYAMLFYAQAGPPAVQAVKVLDAANKVIFAGAWESIGAEQRDFVVSVNGSLRPGGDYRLWVAFDKPMRHRDGAGEIANYAGMNVPLKPLFELTGAELELSFGAAGQWLDTPASGGTPGFMRYADDAFLAPFTVPSDVTLTKPQALTLAVNVQDFAEQSLDADPSTVVDWSGGHWTGYESTDGSRGDSGGTDSTLSLTFSAEGLDTIEFQQLKYQVLEGSLLRLPVVRKGEGEGAVSALVSFSAGPPLGAIAVSWADGETGVKFVEFPISDNLAIGPIIQFGSFQAVVSVTSGLAVATSEAVDIEVLDNDSPERLVFNLIYLPPVCPVCDVPSDPMPSDRVLGDALQFVLQQAATVEGAVVTINLADDQVYRLDGPGVTLLPSIEGQVVIAGHHSRIAYLRREDIAPDGVRLMHVLPGAELTLRGLVLTGGDLGGSRTGGAILNEGTLIAHRVVFRDNLSNRAGALNNRGKAILTNSSFVNNHADHGGGAIYNTGELLLEGVTFSNNSTDARGGALFNSGQATIRSSTFANNTAANGTAIHNTGSATPGNSLLAGADACGGSGIISAGYNLSLDESCGFNAVGDVVVEDAGLSPFDPETALYPLTGTSPAVDAGDPNGCIGSDPRGAPRPFVEAGVNARCDIGAFERALTIHRGLWWNPARPGHGIDLQQTDNRLSLTWFTYQPEGAPVWYQAVAQFTDATWEADLYRFTYDFDDNQASPEIAGTVSLTFASDTEATFAWDLSAIGQGTGTEPFEPFTPQDQPPVFDVTGLWAAADQSDWGLSVDVQGDIAILTVYYYDAEGHARWVQGVGAAVTDTVAVLGSLTGFCPDCTFQPTGAVPVGSLRLQFLTRLQGEISTDFSYPGAAGGAWQREVDLGTLSSPVP